MPDFKFYWWAMQRGLTPATMVEVLLNYIENQGCDDALEDYCRQMAEQEDE